jgi:cytochrome b561
VVAALGWMAGRPATGLGPAEAPAAAAAPAAGPAEPVSPGTATAWRVDPQASRITFSGVHAGAPFTGRFERWEAQIWFDPADLAGSKAVADIATGSARTGDATQEGSLGSAEWLDPAGFPTARFEATAFRALGGDRYEAEGTLTLKEQTVPVTLAFTYRREGEVARVEGTTTLDRMAFDLGMASDPSAQWVSRRIEVKIEVVAQPAG